MLVSLRNWRENKESKRKAADNEDKKDETEKEEDSDLPDVSIFDQMHDIVILLDRDSIIRYANESISKVGYTAADIRGQTIAILMGKQHRHIDHPQLTRSYREMHSSAIVAERGRLVSVCARNGSEIPMKLSITYISTHNLFVGIMSDISLFLEESASLRETIRKNSIVADFLEYSNDIEVAILALNRHRDDTNISEDDMISSMSMLNLSLSPSFVRQGRRTSSIVIPVRAASALKCLVKFADKLSRTDSVQVQFRTNEIEVKMPGFSKEDLQCALDGQLRYEHSLLLSVSSILYYDIYAHNASIIIKL